MATEPCKSYTCKDVKFCFQGRIVFKLTAPTRTKNCYMQRDNGLKIPFSKQSVTKTIYNTQLPKETFLKQESFREILQETAPNTSSKSEHNN